jgi:hypothetical protein
MAEGKKSIDCIRIPAAKAYDMQFIGHVYLL